MDLGALSLLPTRSMPPKNPPPYSVDTPPYPATPTSEGDPLHAPVEYYYYPAGFHRRRRRRLDEYDEVEMCWLFVSTLFVPFFVVLSRTGCTCELEAGARARTRADFPLDVGEVWLNVLLFCLFYPFAGELWGLSSSSE